MRWARENPEAYAEIAALPPSQQNAALREAIGYDPDAIRDRYEEDRIHHHRPLNNLAGGDVVPPQGSGSTPPAETPYADGHCDVCGSPVGKHHLSYCDIRGDV